MTLCLTLIFSLCFSSCAGYRFQEKNNPFAQYGVESISVPMFYNHSNHANISPVMTKEIFQMLSGFNDLKIISGHERADAVLIGIVSSPEKVKVSRPGKNFRSAKAAAGDAIGDEREDFYIPSSTDMRASLRLILIKNPSEKEIELLRTSLGKFALGPRVIVNENIRLRDSFTRELYSSNGVDVIDTQNRSAMRNTMQEMAQKAAQNFKDMILYAF